MRSAFRERKSPRLRNGGKKFRSSGPRNNPVELAVERALGFEQFVVVLQAEKETLRHTEIAGQAKIECYIIDGDNHQVANNTRLTVQSLKNTTIKQPYTGNFFELQVVYATVAPAM